MTTRTVTAVAHPNIALVKYWGKRDPALNLPAVSSLSLTLSGFETRTRVTWGSEADRVELNGRPAQGRAAERVRAFLDRVDPNRPPVEVVSENDFPTAAGLASSSSGFAALALAACRAAGQQRNPTALSRLARLGSGSACRSLWGGFVLWRRGEREDGADSHGEPVLRPESWPLEVVVAVVWGGPKPMGSTEAMIHTARTSPCHPPFVARSEDLVQEALTALDRRDPERLFAAMEHSTALMHATTFTARPPVRFWRPETLAVIEAVEALRRGGTCCGWTLDAGPNVKVFCLPGEGESVALRIRDRVSTVHLLHAGPAPRIEAAS